MTLKSPLRPLNLSMLMEPNTFRPRLHVKYKKSCQKRRVLTFHRGKEGKGGRLDRRCRPKLKALTFNSSPMKVQLEY